MSGYLPSALHPELPNAGRACPPVDDRGPAALLPGSGDRLLRPHSAKRVHEFASERVPPRREGDREAFGVLYRRYRRQLFLYLLALVGQEETAEDLLQETFLRLLRSVEKRGVDRESYGPYLATIARNLATDWHRRHHREVQAREYLARARLLAEGTTATGGVLSAHEATEILWQLPREQREAVLLRIYLGFSFSEIAHVTEVPLNTCVSRYRYGLAKVRDALQEVSSDTQTDA